MILRTLFLSLLLSATVFAHGVFHNIVDGAVAIRVTAPNNIAIDNAKITIYAPESSLPFTKGKTDLNGNFAFVPDSHGKWKVDIDVPSDHGSHLKSFHVTIDEKQNVKEFEKTPYDRYLNIISALGFLFGIFGIISLLKTRKKDTN
ncbi:hypothetical protein [Halarcobacter bivalviorum]|uniref:Membrane protein n=1 Tax=Halarcobacter bivalviorum TaxID=663364 RepID=A0AAX2AAG3_9BACT|nr:hypothetical protein [Halarcobacter bivalviorum]AXH12637.1 putative membrane protein [Halarcobacter bivalviorum]RXK10439.1 hypothetical protein CRV05_03965 [Halarcobacter bivalviorum]